MEKHRRLLSLLVNTWLACSLPALIGCATAAPRYTPISGHADSYFLDDHHFAVCKSKATEVRVAVEQGEGGLILLLACKNTGTDRVNLYPERITVENLLEGKGKEYPLPVLSKLQHIAAIKNEATMASLGVAISGAFDAAQTRGEVARQISRARTDANVAAVSEEYRATIRTVSGSLLGRETLYPGEGVFGEVRASTVTSAPKQIRVSIPIGDDKHVIYFRTGE